MILKSFFTKDGQDKFQNFTRVHYRVEMSTKEETQTNFSGTTTKLDSFAKLPYFQKKHIAMIYGNKQEEKKNE